MKKIIKLLIFIFVCMPIFCCAKTTINHEWTLEDNVILSNKEGNYYFITVNNPVINIYSKEGDKFSEIDFSRMLSSYSFDELVNDRVLSMFLRFSNGGQVFYNSEVDEYYSLDYEEKSYKIYDKESNIDFFELYKFEDDLEAARNVLGIEFDIYELISNEGYDVQNIVKEYGYYIVNGYDPNGIYFVRVYNDKLIKVFEKLDEDNSNFMIHVDNNKIYLAAENTKLEVYDFDNNLLDTFILGEYITDSLEEYEGYLFSFFNFDITNNNVVVSYAFYSTDPVTDVDTSNVTLETGREAYPDLLSFKFRLKYDIEEKIVLNGQVKLENKIDEYDREYVELEVTPDEGYDVHEIMVTDVVGREIEVTNSKFFMPNSDVTVEVQFKEINEVVPIPDTFLGKSLSLILIGFILIGLGVYTINYVKD